METEVTKEVTKKFKTDLLLLCLFVTQHYIALALAYYQAGSRTQTDELFSWGSILQGHKNDTDFTILARMYSFAAIAWKGNWI